jgi:hypothetical protein
MCSGSNHATRFNEHLAHDGAAVFDHASRMGLEKNPLSEACVTLAV